MVEELRNGMKDGFEKKLIVDDVESEEKEKGGKRDF